MSEDFAAEVSGVSALAEPARRELYLFVAAQSEPVSRDQAAEGVGLARHTAKFHLDRLVDEGLLAVEFRRLSGRRGPGAGRPSKLYRRSGRELSVTLPERRYELAGQVLADALEDVAERGVPAREAVARAASRTGRELAARAGGPEGGGPEGGGDEGGGDDAGPHPSSLPRVTALLAEQGYEPRLEDGRVVLANCPFHSLASRHTELVCGLNVGLLSALTEGLGADDVQVSLDPAPGRCCVTLSPSP